MLTIISECRFSLLALKHLFAASKTEVTTFAEWLLAPQRTSSRLLVVASPGSSLLDLLSVFESAIQRGVKRTTLLGTPEQHFFLNRWGVSPQQLLSPCLPPETVYDQVSAWTGPAASQRPYRQNVVNLTPRERLVLLASMKESGVEEVCRRMKISIKTFYSHRHNALKKLGLSSVRQMLGGSCNALQASKQYIGISLDNHLKSQLSYT
ncbi:helix-turn-helix domain-containing protein [[Enterobacter] lignolyticus]|uniref:HTH luxR-type domain-containing protein n=1 Tax=[Enterobacter] lignolyticus TaxID=1334193 RepID=A0A806XH50_9ENTR|nr:helix-turn-helix domain-containing protein [[Enterobacter] lignolyticus]ALR78059.1 hypothetical protein AO703_17780 [[Enterobacter] lignolyticus]